MWAILLHSRSHMAPGVHRRIYRIRSNYCSMINRHDLLRIGAGWGMGMLSCIDQWVNCSHMSLVVSTWLIQPRPMPLYRFSDRSGHLQYNEGQIAVLMTRFQFRNIHVPGTPWPTPFWVRYIPVVSSPSVTRLLHSFESFFKSKTVKRRRCLHAPLAVAG